MEKGSEKAFSSYILYKVGRIPKNFLSAQLMKQQKNACAKLDGLNIHLHGTRQVGPKTAAYSYIHALYYMLVSECTQQGIPFHPRLKAVLEEIKKKDAKHAATTRDQDKYDPAERTKS